MKSSHRRKGKCKGLLTPEEAEKLLQQRCRGMWSDGDDDSSQHGDDDSSHQTDRRQDSSPSREASLAAPEDFGDSQGNSLQEGVKAARKKLRGISKDGSTCSAPNPEEKDPSFTKPFIKEHAKHLTSCNGGQGGNDDLWGRQQTELQQKKTSKRQAKGLRKWSSMQARAARSLRGISLNSREEAQADVPELQTTTRSSNKSLELLKEMGGLSSAFASEGKHNAVSSEDSMRHRAQARELSGTEEDSRKVFDETVHEIRNLVYPHLDRFQQRQFVTTALRALGIGTTKTRKMPLPEYLLRKKSTAAALKARRAEAKLLGVSSHVDSQGSVQQAARTRARLAAQKQRRKHLRDTFKHAGKYTGKRK